MKNFKLKLAILTTALTLGMGAQQVVNAGASNDANSARGGCHPICGIIPGTRCTPSGCVWHL